MQSFFMGQSSSGRHGLATQTLFHRVPALSFSLCDPAKEPLYVSGFPLGACCFGEPLSSAGPVVASKDSEGPFSRPLLWVLSPLSSPLSSPWRLPAADLTLTGMGGSRRRQLLRGPRTVLGALEVGLLARSLVEHVSLLACWRLRSGDLKFEFLFQKKEK